MVDQIVLKKNYMRTLCVTHSIYTHLLTFITNDSVNYKSNKKNTLVHQTMGGWTLGTDTWNQVPQTFQHKQLLASVEKTGKPGSSGWLS